MNSRSGTQARQGWTFVTNHLLVMKCIAEDPEIRMIDIANRIGITERGVQGIVNELVHAGYLVRERVGRRNHYRISTGMPLRHLETEHLHLGELLDLLRRTSVLSVSEELAFFGIGPPDGESAVPAPVRLASETPVPDLLDEIVGPRASNLVRLDSGDSVGAHHLGHGPLMDLPEPVQLHLTLPFEGFEVELRPLRLQRF